MRDPFSDLTELVIATHNDKKLGEMRKILAEICPWLTLLSFADFEDVPEPDETGETYKDNAIIKATSGANFTQKVCLADDAGLEIDALPDILGVMSKRFAGEKTSFDEKMDIILQQMQDIPDFQRSARFNCWIALAAPNGETMTLQGTCEGQIAHEKSGSGGFGYDPIFWLPARDCTMADLTSEEKHQISHRGKVLRKLAQFLSQQRIASS